MTDLAFGPIDVLDQGAGTSRCWRRIRIRLSLEPETTPLILYHVEPSAAGRPDHELGACPGFRGECARLLMAILRGSRLAGEVLRTFDPVSNLIGTREPSIREEFLMQPCGVRLREAIGTASAHGRLRLAEAAGQVMRRQAARRAEMTPTDPVE